MVNALRSAGCDCAGASQRRNNCTLTDASHTPHRRQNFQKAPAPGGRGRTQCQANRPLQCLFASACQCVIATIIIIRVEVRSERPRELTNAPFVYPSINSSEMISVRRGRSRSRRPLPPSSRRRRERTANLDFFFFPGSPGGRPESRLRFPR